MSHIVHELGLKKITVYWYTQKSSQNPNAPEPTPFHSRDTYLPKRAKNCVFSSSPFYSNIREAVWLVLRYSGPSGALEHTAAHNGDIGTPPRSNLLPMFSSVDGNPHSESARDLMLSTNPCKASGKEEK